MCTRINVLPMSPASGADRSRQPNSSHWAIACLLGMYVRWFAVGSDDLARARPPRSRAAAQSECGVCDITRRKCANLDRFRVRKVRVRAGAQTPARRLPTQRAVSRAIAATTTQSFVPTARHVSDRSFSRSFDAAHWAASQRRRPRARWRPARHHSCDEG